ncbi:hypothetical protein [uncultured Alcanivorax sp.]|uniref:hypothetical protein n=1 Tax=uncultured Alcanivorax sp. TaxID=191215 RepID=UPI0025862A71|nr:hypothetical protein [uncultured Alcanivorax sp.]
MLLFRRTQKQTICRITPQQCRTFSMLCILLCSPFAHSALFLGVSPGDSCLETYEMEIDRGAEADFPLHTMLEHELLAFYRDTPERSEVTGYQCGEDRISLVYYGVWFHNEEHQKVFFKTNQAAIEAEFGDPSFNAFNLGWMARLVLWLDGKEDIEETLPLVQWQQKSGDKLMLQYSSLQIDGKAYGVTMSWER